MTQSRCKWCRIRFLNIYFPYFYAHQIAYTLPIFAITSMLSIYHFGVRWIGCLTSQSTIFESYMWRHTDVQADWRRKFDIRSGSQRRRHFVWFINVPVQARTRGHPLFIILTRFLVVYLHVRLLFYVVSATMAIKRRHFSRLLRHAGDTEDIFST